MTARQASAQAFLLKGNSDTALLFIHGFTASPSELLPTAVLLNELGGHTVSGPLLPGHGSSPEEMNQSNWEDWFKAVSKEVCSLQEDYQKVYVMGLSLGALLAIHAAIHCPGLGGVISINAPIFLKDPYFKLLAPLLQVFKPYWPKANMGKILKLEEQGRFAYHCTPVKAFRSMMSLRKQVLREIGKLAIPVLLMQSVQDESVKLCSAAYLAKKAGQAAPRVVNLPDSEHIATMGAEKQLITREILVFIKPN